jgi:hypothetical protein
VSLYNSVFCIFTYKVLLNGLIFPGPSSSRPTLTGQSSLGLPQQKIVALGLDTRTSGLALLGLVPRVIFPPGPRSMYWVKLRWPSCSKLSLLDLVLLYQHYLTSVYVLGTNLQASPHLDSTGSALFRKRVCAVHKSIESAPLGLALLVQHYSASVYVLGTNLLNLTPLGLALLVQHYSTSLYVLGTNL